MQFDDSLSLSFSVTSTSLDVRLPISYFCQWRRLGELLSPHFSEEGVGGGKYNLQKRGCLNKYKKNNYIQIRSQFILI
jgi:hypothetical protein